MLYKNRNMLSKQNEKVGRVFSKIPITPNQWTALSIITALITAYFVIANNFLAAAVFFAITAVLDIIDGAVARFRKSSSSSGAYIDTITDRYVEFIVLFSLLFAGLPKVFLEPYAWIFLGLFGSTMTTYTKAAAKEKELVKKELAGGLLERSERLVLLFAGLVIAAANVQYFVFVIIIYAILSNITALQRIYYALGS